MPLALPAGLFACLFTILVPPPGGMPGPAWIAAGLACMMAIWWFTEALPLAATALVPLALAPLLGVAALPDVAASYSDPLILLFLGGFIVARAVERWRPSPPAGAHAAFHLWRSPGTGPGGRDGGHRVSQPLDQQYRVRHGYGADRGCHSGARGRPALRHGDDAGDRLRGDGRRHGFADRHAHRTPSLPPMPARRMVSRSVSPNGPPWGYPSPSFFSRSHGSSWRA